MDILKEDGVYSLTRVLLAMGYMVFLFVSVYMILTGKTWEHYTEFTTATGSAAMVQLGNKFINSKYNTPQGAAGKGLSHGTGRTGERDS